MQKSAVDNAWITSFVSGKKEDFEAGFSTIGIACCHARFLVPLLWDQ